MVDKIMKKEQNKFTIFLIIIFFIFMYAYTLFHELGHGIIGVIAGGKIVNIALGFNAHITIVDANYNDFTYALMNAFGVLLPLLILLIALLFYNKNSKKIEYHIIYIISAIGTIGSTLAWIILPLVSIFTSVPENDDITKFLNTTGLNPIIISLISFLVLTSLVILIYKKGLFLKLTEIRKEFKNK